MRRGVGRPVIRMCCVLCPVCPLPAQPVIWGHPVGTADCEGVRGGRAGYRRRCALRLERRHPGFVSHLGRPRRHLVCLGLAAPCALPRPIVERARGPPGTLEHWSSLRGRAALLPSLLNDRLRDTYHVLAAGVPERETPAAPPPPPAPLVLIFPFFPPARACCNRHAAGVPRGPAARPCALVTAPPSSPYPPPALQGRPSSPPLFPSMTRKPDRERDTERRRDQRRRHQERLAVLARCNCSCYIARCPPCAPSAQLRGGPALPVPGSCAPPAVQGSPVAGGAWVPPPNALPSQGGGNWAGGAGRSSLPARGSWGPGPRIEPNQGGGQMGGGAGRASLPPRDE